VVLLKEIDIGNLEDSQEVINFLSTVLPLGSIYAVNKFNRRKILPIESLNSTNSQILFDKRNIFCFIVKKNFFEESVFTWRTDGNNNGIILSDKFICDVSPLPERYDIFNYSLNAVFLEDKFFEYTSINNYDIKNGYQFSVFEHLIYFKLMSTKKTETTWNLQLINESINIDDLIEYLKKHKNKYLDLQEVNNVVKKDNEFFDYKYIINRLNDDKNYSKLIKMINKLIDKGNFMHIIAIKYLFKAETIHI
jgi:hypothetical protein